MSTNGTISYYDEATNTIKGIYSHRDSDVNSNGLTLHTHYNSLEKVKELVSKGGVSILDDNIGEKIDFNESDLRRTNKQCLFYSRDRGEDLEIFEFEEYDDFLEAQGQEYNYLFVGDEWTYSSDDNQFGNALETALLEKGIIDIV